MGSQGPGRKRTTSKNGLTAEEDALNVIAREAEARLAAKRAARAEAREIRMKELERQQKEIYQVQKKYYGLDNLDNKWGDIEQWMEDSERYTRLSRRHASVSDDEERMSVGSRSNVRLDVDAAGAYGVLPQASSYSHKKSKKKKKHSSKTSNGYDDDLSTLSSRSSRLSDESKRSRSSRLDLQPSTYYSPEPYSSSSYSSKHQGLSYNGYQGSLYEDSVYSGSRRSIARASSEYSGLLGSSSRTSSRANSACGSPVEDCSSSVSSYMRSTASISGLTRNLDHVIIPDLPDVNGRLSMADDRLERDYLEKGSSRASTISGTTLTSLGGTSSRRGSGDTSISADTEASIREIKEIHELKDQIQDVEAKHMQNLKELKDSLLEVEDKYRKAMVSNAQLDNEKTNLIYEVDTLKDSLMELEEMLFETRRELEEKSKDLEREKHAHSILQFQFSELKETLKQSEELLTEIRQLRLKQDGFVREISDLQETIEWKNKKIGALERQKEFSDAIRNERDELRDEVVQLKDILKKHGIVLGPDLATNGETGEEVGEADQSSRTSPAEMREGSSVLGTRQLKMCKDQHQKYLDEEVKENQMSSHVPMSSTTTSLKTNEIGDNKDEINQGVEQQQSDNIPKKLSSSVGDDKLTSTNEIGDCKDEINQGVEQQQSDNIPKKPSSSVGDDKLTSTNEVGDHKDEINQGVEQQQSDIIPKKLSNSVGDDKPTSTNEIGDCKDEINQGVEQQQSDIIPKKPSNSVVDDKLTSTRPTDKIKTEQLESEDSEVNTVESKSDVHTDGPMKTDQQKSKCAKRSQTIQKEDSVESESGPVLEDPDDQPGEDNKSRPVEKPVEPSQTGKLPQTQGASVSNKKKKRKKKNKQKQKQSEKQESETKMDDKSKKDNPDQQIKHDPERNRDEHLGKNAATAVNTVVPADTDDHRSIEMDSVKIIGTKIPADNARDQFQVTTDVVDSTASSNPITNLDCPESKTGNNTPSEVSISNITDIIDDQTEDSTNLLQEVSLEKEALLSHELSDKPMDAVEQAVETLESISSSNNVEKSLLVDIKDEKRDVVSKAKVEEASLQNIDPEENTLLGDHDESATAYHLSSSVKENLKNEEVAREQPTVPIDQEVENLQNGVEVDQTEVKTQQEESAEEALIFPSEDVFSGDYNIDPALPESQVQPILQTCEGEVEEKSLCELSPDAQLTRESEADLESLKASDQDSRIEKDEDEKERSVQEQVLQLPVEILVGKVEEDEKEESPQDDVMFDVQLSKEREDIRVEEGSVQDPAILGTQLTEEDDGILVESVTVSSVLKEEDEEDEGESFDFDDVDLEASSHELPKHCQDRLNEKVALLNESKEYQSNDTDKHQIQEDDESLKLADQESEQMIGHAIKNQQTAEVETCLTVDNQVDSTSGSKECTLQKHHQASEELRHNKETDLLSEIETRDVDQEINNSIIHENQGSKTVREQEVEMETAKTNKEDYRKESKKSSKKGKGKGKEECKMS